jgi:hypothetical protein
LFRSSFGTRNRRSYRATSPPVNGVGGIVTRSARRLSREARTIAIEEPIGREQFRKVKVLFRVLSCLPADERSEVLEELCPEDLAVRRLVLRLLEEPEPH